MLRLLLAAAVAAGVPFVPNDPGYPAASAPLEALSVPQAWSLTQGDPAIVIAIVDDGVAPDPDLALVAGNATAGTHGTQAALIAAAQIDNGIGGAGICGRCLVMPATDIDWALDHGADVISVTRCGAQPPKDAIDRAVAHGVRVFVCPSEARAFDNAAYTGIAGLMLSCNPVLRPAEITQLLIRASDNGVVNAYRAVEYAGCRANTPEIVRLMVNVRGHGTVSRRPDDDTYNAGTVVAMRAKADPGWRFARWSGICSGRRRTCTVRLVQSGMTTAIFRRR
jgi:subtilisin family serine protease